MTSCCMNFAIRIQWIYFTIWKKEEKNCHHYNTISRHYKKSLLKSQIYHGYEELSTDTNYPIWRRQERRSKYAVQLASWQLRSNSPKTSVRHTFLAATKQLYEWYFLSVCLSHLFDCVSISVSSRNSQELLPMTEVMSMQKVKVKGQGHRGHNPT